MSSSRDNISLYNENQYQFLTYEQPTSYSNINSDNNQVGFEHNLAGKTEQEQKAIIDNNFKWLELELLKNQKTISALDFYKIEGNLGDNSIPISSLLKNHSLVCSNPVTINGQQFVSGDILYKKNDGSLEKISLGLSGIYVPILKNNNSTFSFEWKWEGGRPNTENEPKSFVLQQANNGYYGIIKKQSDNGTWDSEIIFDQQKKQDQTITPVIKGYNINNEEVFWDFSLTKDTQNNQWILKEIPAYIKTIVVK